MPARTPAQKTKQARPPATQPFDAQAFGASDRTTIRWTGNAGFFVNSRGTTFMIDPLLQGFDMPILIDMPIRPKDVPRLDAVLVTHSDNDHYSVPTLRDLVPVTKAFHSTGVRGLADEDTWLACLRARHWRCVHSRAGKGHAHARGPRVAELDAATRRAAAVQ